MTARGGVRGMALLLVLLAAAAGMAITTQFAVNSELGRAAGGALAASAISFLVGTVALFAAVLVARQTPSPAALAGAPWWAWVGGLLGAFFVFASVVLTPRLGVASAFGFIIAGQMVASVVLDQFGLLNLDVHPVSLARLAGVALVVLGAFLVLRF